MAEVSPPRAAAGQRVAVREPGAPRRDRAWGARGDVRRAVVLGGGEHLGDEHEQDHLAAGGGVRPRAPARTQDHKEKGSEFAPHRLLAYGPMRAGLFLAYWP